MQEQLESSLSSANADNGRLKDELQQLQAQLSCVKEQLQGTEEQHYHDQSKYNELMADKQHAMQASEPYNTFCTICDMVSTMTPRPGSRGAAAMLICCCIPLPGCYSE